MNALTPTIVSLWTATINGDLPNGFKTCFQFQNVSDLGSNSSPKLARRRSTIRGTSPVVPARYTISSLLGLGNGWKYLGKKFFVATDHADVFLLELEYPVSVFFGFDHILEMTVVIDVVEEKPAVWMKVTLKCL